MPWVKVQDGHEEVDPHCGCGGDDKICEDVVSDRCFCCYSGGGLGESLDDDVEGGEGRVHHDNGVGGHSCCEHLFSPLRTVTHGEDKLGGDEEEHKEFEDGEYSSAPAAAERVEEGVGEGAGDEVECEVEVCEGEICEEEGDELVEEFNVQEDFTDEGMVRGPDLAKVNERVDGSEESTVEPATALRDEFGDSICTHYGRLV